MNSHQLEKLLQQDVPPPPDAAARRAARQVALAEFARVQAEAAHETAASRWSMFQALLGTLRLSSHTQRSDDMPWYSRRMLLGGAASVCLVIVGGALTWKTLRVDPSLAVLSAPHESVSVPTKDVGELPPPVTSEAAAEPEARPREEESKLRDAQSRRDAEQAAVQAASRQELAKKEKDEARTRVPIAPPPAAQAPEKSADAEEVVVTGLRARIQQSLEIKRDAVGVIDSISAEDIGQFPD